VTVAAVDDGWDYHVLVLDGRWVIRAPRRAEVVPWLEAEIALLPALAPALPVRVPQFEHVSLEPPLVVYRLIEGEPLVDEDAAGVRAFLEALHAFDPGTLPVRRPDWLDTHRELADEFRTHVVPQLDVDERDRAAGFLEEVETLVGFAPALTHSDLGPEHLRVHGGRLHGVIDWGDARVGDPAIDYAWLLDGPFPDWEVDEELRRRARFYHRLGPFFEVHYGVTQDKPAHVTAGVAGIRTRL
jgi:aminoglycoside phosphotransferase (APT) family kinase protein